MKEFSKIICNFLKDSDKKFFASLLMYVEKKKTKSIPTMGVSSHNSDITLYYNPDFITKLRRADGLKAIEGIIEHEILHLVFDHLTRAINFKRERNIYNIATDMAVNQRIDKKRLPQSLIPTPEKIKRAKSGEDVEMLVLPEVYDLPENKNAEWYYGALMKKAKKNKKGSCGKVGFDEHKWDNNNKQLSREAVKRAIKEAVKQTEKMQGEVPGNLTEAINELLKKPEIDWKRLFKKFIGGSIKSNFKRSWKRPNRRFPNRQDVKGKTAERMVRVLCGVDTSGSISTQDFQKFLTELKSILRCYKSNVEVVLCDTEITDKVTLKPRSKLKVKFKGRGGTSFKPVFDHMKDNPQYDVLIYFTDGYCDYNKCETTKPTIWVFTEDSSKQDPPFGRLVRMKKEEE